MWKRLWIEHMHLNITNAIQGKHIANVTWNGEKPQNISTKFTTKARVSIFYISIQHDSLNLSLTNMRSK